MRRIIILQFMPIIAVRYAAAEIQIIGTGTGRTGSTTLQKALEILGYKTYHMKEMIFGGRSSDIDFWIDAFRTNCSEPEQLKELFEGGGYNATVHAINFPCHHSLLFDLYPDAKVIHTQRANAQVWHDSAANSICKNSDKYWPLRILGIIFPVFRRARELLPLLMGRVAFGVHEGIQGVNRQYCLDHKEQMMNFYNSHNAKIREIVPAERLLVITSHQQGWGPICDFLGIPVPDIPFPHLNKRSSMIMTLAKIQMEEYKDHGRMMFLAGSAALLLLILVSSFGVFPTKKKSEKVKTE